MEQRFTLDESQLQTLVRHLMDISPAPQVYCFRGDLGAGKTTLIKQIAKALGFSGDVSSPTYGLVNTYPFDHNRSIYHTDWYRINELDELYDAGIEDSLYNPDAIWLIEWPQVGMEILMGFHVLDIEIKHLDQQREYILTDYPLYTM